MNFHLVLVTNQRQTVEPFQYLLLGQHPFVVIDFILMVCHGNIAFNLLWSLLVRILLHVFQGCLHVRATLGCVHHR